MLPRNPGYHRQGMFCCNPSWHAGSWSRQHTKWDVGTSGWPLGWVTSVEVCRRWWSYNLRRLRTTTLSLIVLETGRPTTIPSACGQTCQGRDSCSGLTQLVRSWKSLACLQLCSGSPVGRWWKPCSYRLAAQWQRSCFQWGPRCSAGVCWVVGRLRQHFCCRALRRALYDPRWTHPARVAVVALVMTNLVSISRNAATARATWRQLSYPRWMIRQQNGDQHLHRDILRPSSGLKELAQTMRLVPTNANLAMVLLASFFKAGRKLVSVSRMVFSRYCSCQDDCGVHYA